LMIDHTCHVVGSIAFALCNQNDRPCSGQTDFTIESSFSLWRSRDGSRLSGFQLWSCSREGKGCGHTPPPNVLPFELIEGQ
jgi:hypothetical protein